ncbi:MAG: NAD-dependent epimerase/dehydratase family protein [Bacteroidota bacterium]|nr:NAD-dependent epimerase/dehydratase family protein [Bacteroidota bacterium]
MVFVTGATGLVGSHLVLYLLKKEYKVRALKRKTSSFSIIKNVFDLYADENPANLFDKIEWVDGDITDLFSIEEALNDIDEVYHCSGLVSYQKNDKKRIFDININGTANVVNASIRADVKKFLYVSSVASLGRAEKNTLHTEEIIWENSKERSDYSVSKYLGEQEVWRGSEEGLNVVIINPSIILGIGNTEKGSTKLFTKVYEGLKFYTDGINGFVDVRDVANTAILLMESTISGERFIINGDNVSYKKLFKLIAENFKVNPPKYRAGSILSGIYWRTDWLVSKLTGREQIVSRSTAKTAQQKHYFSNQKIKNYINHNFIPIEKTIKDSCAVIIKKFD